MINLCKASQSELFPAKYIKTSYGHVFAPKHTNGVYLDLYESFYDLTPIHLVSLHDLNQYIITEENGDWFIEHLNEKKFYYTIKVGRQFDFVLPIDSVVLYKYELGRFKQFLPIQVRQIGSIYEVVDGHHRLEYSIIKGYSHRNVCLVT
jgi:hypothetical protein